MESLSVKECVSFGWHTFKSRAWFFIGVSAVFILASIAAKVPDWASRHIHSTYWGVPLAGYLITFVLTLFVSMLQTTFLLRAHDDVHAVTIADSWYLRPFGKFLIAAVLSGLLILVGFILLIIPGIFLGLIFSFVPYVVIDKDLGAVAAMKESARLTKGNRWKLIGLGFALIGINILGFCALIIGLLVSMPVSALALAHAYRILCHEKSSEMPPVTSVPQEPATI